MHGVNHELGLLSELNPDDLEEVTGGVWPNREHSGRVGARVEIGDNEGVLNGIEDVWLAVTDSVVGF